jgi:hypothetical protein
VITVKTKELEHIAYENLKKNGTYLCFEVMIPYSKGRGYGNNERVDLLTYETRGIWRFYELKVSKSDFHSKCKLSWYGNFNYYIMPYELYTQVLNEIPAEIGVYVAKNNGCFWCEKKPKKQELKLNHNLLLFSFMQSLSREYAKYRKVLLNINNENKSDKQIILNDNFDHCKNCIHTNCNEDVFPCSKCSHGNIDYFEQMMW